MTLQNQNYEKIVATQAEIKTTIKSLKTNKLPGPKGINLELVKHGTEKLFPRIMTTQ